MFISHVFRPSHLNISDLHIFASLHPCIFASSQLHISSQIFLSQTITSHIFTFQIFRPSQFYIFTSSHLTSSHLHIFTSSHFILTFHLLTSSHVRSLPLQIFAALYFQSFTFQLTFHVFTPSDLHSFRPSDLHTFTSQVFMAFSYLTYVINFKLTSSYIHKLVYLCLRVIICLLVVSTFSGQPLFSFYYWGQIQAQWELASPV